MTSAVNFGLGPAKTLATGAVNEILQHLSDTVSLALRTAARLVAEAVRKLWAAFGAKAQDDIQTETQTWLKKVWNNGRLITGLLNDLYKSEDVKAELKEIIRKANVTSDFNGVNRRCSELNARFKKIKSILDWLLRAMGWLKKFLMAAVPWGPIAAYSVYVGTIGYAICSGGDYMDAERFQATWLDHVVGIRTIVKTAAVE
jgi:hypothetical protein